MLSSADYSITEPKTSNTWQCFRNWMHGTGFPFMCIGGDFMILCDRHLLGRNKQTHTQTHTHTHMLTPLLTSDWEHAPDQSNDCTKSNSVSDEVLLWELVEIWVRGYYRGRQRWFKTHQLPHGKAHFNKADDSWTLQPWSSLQMAQQPENLSPAAQLLSLFSQQLFTPSKVCVCVGGG